MSNEKKSYKFISDPEHTSSADIVSELSELSAKIKNQVEAVHTLSERHTEAVRSAALGGNQDKMQSLRDKRGMAEDLAIELDCLQGEGKVALRKAITRETALQIAELDADHKALDAEREKIFARAAKAAGEIIACLAELNGISERGAYRFMPSATHILKVIRFGVGAGQPVPTILCNCSVHGVSDGLKNPPDENARIIAEKFQAACQLPSISERRAALNHRKGELTRAGYVAEEMQRLLDAANINEPAETEDDSDLDLEPVEVIDAETGDGEAGDLLPAGDSLFTEE